MRTSGFVLLAPVVIFLSGCNHLISAGALESESSTHQDSQPPPSMALPDMPSWVKFVRFKPHTHSTVATLRIAQQRKLPAEPLHLAPEQLQLSTSPYSTGAEAAGDSSAPQNAQPPQPVALVNSDQPCRGQGGYVDADNERWLSERDDSRWTIQLVSASDEKEPCVDQYLSDLNTTDARRYAVFFQGAIWHIALLGDFPTAEAALQAARLYPDPWVRNFAELRERRCASVRRVRGLGNLINPWCNASRPDQQIRHKNPLAVSLKNNDGVPSL